MTLHICNLEKREEPFNELGQYVLSRQKKYKDFSLSLASYRKICSSSCFHTFYNHKFISVDTMKFSTGIIVSALVAILVASVSAEETYLIAIRSLLHVEEPISAAELQAIDNAMNEIGTDLDIVVDEVVTEHAAPSTRKLRVSDDRKLTCSPCTGWPANYSGCWVSGIYRDRCRRALTMHEDLSEDAIADLGEDDRRRHLQISTMCQEAKTGVSSAIQEATSEGIVPLPEGGKFVEQCFYEIV